MPRNAIKARFHHPMVLGVKTWALAHLLANGSVAHVVLFGSFLAWESKAGKFGTFVLFLGLAFGMVGFVAKYLIQWYMSR